ncbi:MAG TPA: SDR family NAD(P)-dependent oxidoreductase [Solirubrobacteraceae bacterium]
MINALLDTILDRTVVAGYTSAGYRIRRRTWNAADLQPMDGKLVLVTGATSGLGLAAAEGFARLGASVRLLARNEERGERAREELIARSGDSDVEVELCDLSDLKAVRRFADRFGEQASRLDVLVNNAGALLGERTVSPDGIELTFATNVLGPFLLTNLLTPLLKESAPARIVNVSSGGMYTQRVHVEDLQSADEEFDGPTAYARTKRAQVILTEQWAERLKGTGVVVHAMHPGWADTPGLQSSLPRFYGATRRLLRTPQEGADTIVWLGAAPEPARSSGGFWHDRRERPTHRVPWTGESVEDRERLWAECERLSGWHEIPTKTNSNTKPIVDHADARRRALERYRVGT